LRQTRKILALDKNGEVILGRLRPLSFEVVKSQQRATESGCRRHVLFCQINAPKNTGFFARARPDAPNRAIDFKIKRQALQSSIVDDDLSIWLNIGSRFGGRPRIDRTGKRAFVTPMVSIFSAISLGA
jgi:hypothetical protein